MPSLNEEGFQRGVDEVLTLKPLRRIFVRIWRSFREQD